MKTLSAIDPDLCIESPDIITSSCRDIVLPQYFYNQLEYLKNGNFREASESAALIINGLFQQEKSHPLLFKNKDSGTIYFINQELNWDDTSNVIEGFDISSPLDRYLLSLFKLAQKLSAKIVLLANSATVISKGTALGFEVVRHKEFLNSGESWLGAEILSDLQPTSELGSGILLKHRYRILKALNSKGLGKTFLAVDESSQSKQRCLIQQYHTPNPESAELFRTKAIYLSSLGKHHQLPQLLNHFSQGDRYYLVQEYIDGVSLQQESIELGAFSESKIRQLLIDVLSVLQFLHSQQIVHRDIKPQNIIRRRADNQLILVDFGSIGLLSGDFLAKEAKLIGHPEYASPEQLAGQPTFASDLYSLGVSCIHLLTLAKPFDLFHRQELTWTWRDYLLDNNPVGQTLGHILDKLIEPNIDRRYQSTDIVLSDLYPQVINWIEQNQPRASRSYDRIDDAIEWRDIKR